MIKAIVFDLWNTIMWNNKGRKISKNLTEKLDSVNFDRSDFVNFGFYRWMCDGKGIAENYFKEYCKSRGFGKEYVNILNEYWNAIFENTTLIKGMPKIIKKLKKNYKIGLLSNAGFNPKKKFEEFEVSNYFDVKVYSYLEGIVKPNENIYFRTCRRLGVKPPETIFTDDIQSFVDGANYVGMEGILFKGAKNLKEELRKRGIKI